MLGLQTGAIRTIRGFGYLLADEAGGNGPEVQAFRVVARIHTARRNRGSSNEAASDALDPFITLRPVS